MNIVDFVSQYWGVGLVLVGGGAWALTHQQLAKSYAKKIILKLMLAAEKGAEELILNNGQEKLTWVVEKGYTYLPPVVKVFVSKALFAVIVQKLFDEAKELIEENKAKTDI